MSFSRESTLMPGSPESTVFSLDLGSSFQRLEAEEAVRFANTDILPYFSETSSTSDSDFDTQTDQSASSFCKDSNRITLGSLIGFPMDSFRLIGESFRLISQGESRSNRSIDTPRRSRSCSVVCDFFACLKRAQATDEINQVNLDKNSSCLNSFIITEVSEYDEQHSSDTSNSTEKLFVNSVFEDRPSLGSRLFELNPLYISDAISESGSSEDRDEDQVTRKTVVLTTAASTKGGEESPHCEYPRFSPSLQSPSNIACLLTTICCRLGDDLYTE